MCLQLKRNFSGFIKKLSKPYPYYYRGKSLGLLAGFIFIATFLFVYIFEPFQVYIPEHKMNYVFISAIHAFVFAIIVVLISSFRIFKSRENNWTLLNEIFLISIYLIVVGIGQFLARDIIYKNPENWSWRYLYEEIRNTFLVGSLFAAFFISINYNRLKSRNIRYANTINISKIPLKLTTINQSNKNLDFNVNDLLFALAEGNYVRLFFNDGTKTLIRTTFKKLEASLKNYPAIIRTHRSYLVNINYIKKISGNAAGYTLIFENSLLNAPVSRSMIPNFKETMKRI